MPRLQLRHRDAARCAAIAFRKHFRDRLSTVVAHHLCQPLGKTQRRFHGVGDAAPIFGAHHETIDNHGHGMVDTSIELGRIRQLDEFPIHDGTHKALLAGALEQILELALPLLHQRRPDFESGTFGPRKYHLRNLRRTLALYGTATARAVGRACTGIEQPQVVVHLGHGTNRRARIVSSRLLLNRDGGREPLDGVNVRLLHQAEELPGVGREGLDVPTLPLGIDGVEGERGLPGTRQTSHDRELISRNGDGDVSQVMLARTTHHERIGRADWFGHSHGRCRSRAS